MQLMSELFRVRLRWMTSFRWSNDFLLGRSLSNTSPGGEPPIIVMGWVGYSFLEQIFATHLNLTVENLIFGKT